VPSSRNWHGFPTLQDPDSTHTLPRRAYTSLVATRNGKGLLALTAVGNVNSLGRASDPGDGECPCEEICHCSGTAGLVGVGNGKGLWVLAGNGQVETLGRVRDLGDFPAPLPGDSYISLAATPQRPRSLGHDARRYAEEPRKDQQRHRERRCRLLRGYRRLPGPRRLRGPRVATPNGMGLWAVGAHGHVQSLGRASRLGDLPAPLPGDSYTSMVATPSGRGLWGVTEGGHVGTVGDAVFLGDLSDVGVCVSCVP